MMTVKELRESLENYGDHLQVRVVIDEELGTLEGVDTISTEEDKELGKYVAIYTAPEDELEGEDDEDDDDDKTD